MAMVAAQETMLVCLRPLSAPGEKLGHNWCTYKELWAGDLSSRDLEEELYHRSLKPSSLGPALAPRLGIGCDSLR